MKTFCKLNRFIESCFSVNHVIALPEQVDRALVESEWSNMVNRVQKEHLEESVAHKVPGSSGPADGVVLSAEGQQSFEGFVGPDEVLKAFSEQALNDISCS